MSTHGLVATGHYAVGSVGLKVLMTAECSVFMGRILGHGEPDELPSPDDVQGRLAATCSWDSVDLSIASMLATPWISSPFERARGGDRYAST
jgi:hypothetical protein